MREVDRMSSSLLMPKILRWGALLFALAALLLPVCAEEVGPWRKRTFKSSDGLLLPYRLLSPTSVDSSKRYPLVLSLHGAGERGCDNATQLKNGVNEFYLAHRERYPAFVLAPQCPEGQRWVEVDWTNPSHVMADHPSAPLQAVIELLDAAERELPIDRSRVYVVGLSMGGFGTWELLARQPERFAAAVPICGGADLATAPRVRLVPVWAFHGAADPVVGVQRSATMVEALRALGVSVRYTEYPEVGHDAWVHAFAEPELAPWLFGRHRDER